MTGRPWLRRCIAIAAAVMVVSSASVALADGRAELEKARASFLARNWTDAEERLRVLLDPKTGLKERPLISQARMYLGASLLAQGRKDDAKEAFEKLVLDDPTYEPDPLSFPGDAINTFIDVRSSLLEQIKTASQNAARLAAERKAREEAEREAQRVWLEKVKEQASEEKITVRHSRIVACLPFGVGQFQNGQPLLGWIFLGTQVAALAGSGITFGMYRYAREREDESLKAQTAYYQQLSAQWHQRANDIQLVNLGFIGAFVAIAGAGVVQANVAFVSESAEKKKRDLPPLSLTTGRTTRLRAVVVADPPQAGRETFERAPSTVRAAARGQKSVSSIAPLVSALPGHDGSLAGVFVGVSGVVF